MDKPPLFNQRPEDWFAVGDLVMCYIGDNEDRFVPDRFVRAEVKMSYSPPVLWIQFEKPVLNRPFPWDQGSSYRTNSHRVMGVWEYNYLLEHPDFAELWARSASQEYHCFDADKFLAALAAEPYGHH